ncbi:MAG: peptidyl-tRNA hydrolase, partial [Myxococcaceae bacterium]|nr:peptidyl-tRNA hydrolase [Myxococcaceae bacterium]
VHDELDLPFGKLQLKSGGGSGGHNGLNSIRESWGQEGYGRLRFGIGKPEGPNAKERVVGHVLGDFSKDERHALPELIGRSMEACEGWVREGMQGAMNRFNRK